MPRSSLAAPEIARVARGRDEVLSTTAPTDAIDRMRPGGMGPPLTAMRARRRQKSDTRNARSDSAGRCQPTARPRTAHPSSTKARRGTPSGDALSLPVREIGRSARRPRRPVSLLIGRCACRAELRGQGDGPFLDSAWGLDAGGAVRVDRGGVGVRLTVDSGLTDAVAGDPSPTAFCQPEGPGGGCRSRGAGRRRRGPTVTQADGFVG